MRPSFGLTANYIWAWLQQPIAKAKLLHQLERGDIRAELVDQLIGANFPTRDDKTLIWLHAKTLAQAESFGEVVAHFQDRPDVTFLWTTEEEDKEGVFNFPGLHQHIPLDHPTFTAKFLAKWRPDALVWLSGSIYPVLLRSVAREGILAIYANAGLSRAQARRFLWFPKFISLYLGCFGYILAKTDVSANRLRRANVPREKLEVLGVMHAGARALPHDEMARTRFAGQMNNRPIWLAAHVDPGEVATLGKTQRRVSRVAQGLMLILNMTSKAHATSARVRLSALGLKVVMQEDDRLPDAETDIFITHGEENLGVYYRLAPVCFLGQSLVRAGGHDPFEAAALGSAILHGPNTQTYQSSYDRLADASATRMVLNSEMLSTALSETLSPDRAAEMAHAAWEVCSAGAEVNDRVIELLDGFFEKGDLDAAA
jgi:3-deoxy-D-manno-octulosonic-acid transferase